MSLSARWIELVAADLEDFRKSTQRPPPDGEELPSWVKKVDVELERMLFPVAAKQGEQLTARKVGALLGQTYAYFGWVLECFGSKRGALVDHFKKSAVEFFTEDGFASEDYAAILEEETRSMWEFGILHAWVRFQHVAKRAMSLVCERSFREAAGFFEGFSAALQRRAKDNFLWTDKYSTASAYFVLRRQYEFVQTFKNVSDLHIFLQNRLGRNAAGDLDRTRMLAKRLGLKLAARGRPSKKWVKPTE